MYLLFFRGGGLGKWERVESVNPCRDFLFENLELSFQPVIVGGLVRKEKEGSAAHSHASLVLLGNYGSAG